MPARRPSARPARRRGPHPGLRPALDRLYDEFNRADSATDPVHVVRRYPDPADREVAGFLAAGLAFGRVASVLASIEGVLAPMGDSPAAYVRRFDPRRDGGALGALAHRWATGPDLVAFVWTVRQMLDRAGSIERFFLAGLDPGAADVGAALESFGDRARALEVTSAYGRRPARPGVWFFFSRPSTGSACKRLNLYLRWMVRRDEIDMGLWRGVSPAQLVVPLDTHVIRVGRCLGLTRRRTPGWRMAVEITASLRALDPGDPVRYDFALCHLGMMNACGFQTAQRDRQCPLRGLCHPAAR